MPQAPLTLVHYSDGPIVVKGGEEARKVGSVGLKACLVQNLAWECSARKVDPAAALKINVLGELPGPGRFVRVRTKQAPSAKR